MVKKLRRRNGSDTSRPTRQLPGPREVSIQRGEQRMEPRQQSGLDEQSKK